MNKRTTVFTLAILTALLSLGSCTNVTTVPDGYGTPGAEQTENSPADSTTPFSQAASTETTDESDMTEISTEPIRVITAIESLKDYLDYRWFTQGEVHSRLSSVCQTPGIFVRLLSETDDFNTPLIELKTYSLEELNRKCTPRTGHFSENARHAYDDTSRLDRNINYLNHFFPVQRITKIDDDHVCFIYRTEYGGATVYNYKVYERFYGDPPGTLEPFEYWREFGENYYVNKLFSYSDFSRFKPGDVIDEQMLSDLVMIKTSGNIWFNNNTINTAGTEFEYEKQLNPNVRFCKAAILTKEGVAIITNRIVHKESVYDFQDSVCYWVDSELIPYGAKCDKYPLISILADGFYPPLPE